MPAVGYDADHIVLSREFVKSVGPSDDLLHGVSYARHVQRRNIVEARDVELGKHLKLPMAVIGSTAGRQSGFAIHGRSAAQGKSPIEDKYFGGDASR